MIMKITSFLFYFIFFLSVYRHFTGDLLTVEPMVPYLDHAVAALCKLGNVVGSSPVSAYIFLFITLIFVLLYGICLPVNPVPAYIYSSSFYINFCFVARYMPSRAVNRLLFIEALHVFINRVQTKDLNQCPVPLSWPCVYRMLLSTDLIPVHLLHCRPNCDERL